MRGHFAPFLLCAVAPGLGREKIGDLGKKGASLQFGDCQINLRRQLSPVSP